MDEIRKIWAQVRYPHHVDPVAERLAVEASEIDAEIGRISRIAASGYDRANAIGATNVWFDLGAGGEQPLAAADFAPIIRQHLPSANPA